jgi:hypothetical protein
MNASGALHRRVGVYVGVHSAESSAVEECVNLLRLRLAGGVSGRGSRAAFVVDHCAGYTSTFSGLLDRLTLKHFTC